jgi:hypothetical protein
VNVYEEQRLDYVVQFAHSKHCDRDMCHPDCPYRKSAGVNDWYPGKFRGY